MVVLVVQWVNFLLYNKDNDAKREWEVGGSDGLWTNSAKLDGNKMRHREPEQFGSKVQWMFLKIRNNLSER